MKNKKNILICIILVFTIILVIRLTINPPQIQVEYSTSNDMAVSVAPMESYEGYVYIEESYTPHDRKIITSSNIFMSTDTFDLAIENIRNEVNEKNGYIEYSNLYTSRRTGNASYRTYVMNIRIPYTEHENILNFIEAFGKINSSFTTAEDVTFQYNDAQSRLEVRKIEEQRILELISQTNDISDLITLEEMLSEARNSIRRLEAQIFNLQDVTNYSTIRLELDEVSTFNLNNESSFLGRLRNAFITSLEITKLYSERTLMFIVTLSIPFLIICAILVLIRFVLTKIRSIRRR